MGTSIYYNHLFIIKKFGSITLVHIPEFTVCLKSKIKSSQGIDTPAAEQGKATKRIENGILVIEKNGVKYTILGNVMQ